MDRLFTPWRLPYILAQTGRVEGCIFCDAVDRIETEPLVVHRGERCFVILNKYPYNNGHVMVVPKRHLGRLVELEAEELLEFSTLTQMCEGVLAGIYHPHGFNMGLNLGKPAGAGVLDHLHMHIVPRWNGDTNFMTVVGETRVLPEELADAGLRIKAAFAELNNSKVTSQNSE